MNSSVLAKVERELKAVQRAVRNLSANALSMGEKQFQSAASFYLGEVERLTESTRKEIQLMENEKTRLEENIFKENYDFYAGIARDYLYEETVKACQSSKEFGQEPYRGALLQVARHPAIAVIYRLGLFGINVDYQMNEIAGHRFQYFRAVEAASKEGRKELPTPADPSEMFRSEGPDEGERLSDLFWEEKIYNADYNADVIEEYGDMYDLIVERRFSKFETLAPFWSLLDQGNVSPKREPGGRGIGKPYPEQKPTHFVSIAKLKAEQDINKKVKADIKEGEKEIDRNKEVLYDAIAIYEGIFQELLDIVDNIELKIQRQFAELTQAVFNRAMENISKSQKAQKIKFTEGMKQAILERSKETAYKILSGIPVDQAYLGAYGGTRDTRSYQVRVRTIDLVKDVSKRVDIKVIDKVQNITESLLSKIQNHIEKYKNIRNLANKVLRGKR